MKSELIVQDFGGVHNANGDKTTARLLKGGSWKRQRIVVILPSAALIPAKVALSHWNLIFPPNNGVCRILAQGMEVGDAYSQAIAGILSHPDLSQWEYILTLEHDNMPPQNGVIQLIEQLEHHPELDCVGGLYFTKGEGGVAQIWGDPKDPITNFRPQLPDPAGGLVECCGTGMGFNLWRMSLFKDEKLRKPWFHTQVKDGCATQDLYAWSDFRKYGHRCAIDCSVKVGHYDHVTDTCW
jgi:hypothetical protein